MKLLTKDQRAKLLANGAVNRQRRDAGQDDIDFPPVVKLFTPDGGATWLLSEIDPDDNDTAFGLCDLGFGSPELGSVSLAEIAELRGHLGLPVERDRFFMATDTVGAYAREAQRLGMIQA